MFYADILSLNDHIPRNRIVRLLLTYFKGWDCLTFPKTIQTCDIARRGILIPTVVHFFNKDEQFVKFFVDNVKWIVVEGHSPGSLFQPGKWFCNLMKCPPLCTARVGNGSLFHNLIKCPPLCTAKRGWFNEVLKGRMKFLGWALFLWWSGIFRQFK